MRATPRATASAATTRRGRLLRQLPSPCLKVALPQPIRQQQHCKPRPFRPHITAFNSPQNNTNMALWSSKDPQRWEEQLAGYAQAVAGLGKVSKEGASLADLDRWVLCVGICQVVMCPPLAGAWFAACSAARGASESFWWGLLSLVKSWVNI